MNLLRSTLVVSLIVFVQLIQAQPPCELRVFTAETQLKLPVCNGSEGEIFIFDTEGGIEPYTYILGEERNQTGIFTDLTIGIYDFIIEDVQGCQKPFQVRFLYREIDKIIRAENTFTPNGDGINDTWFINGITSFEGAVVRVFNRWGQQVYVNSVYENEFGWNGKQGGTEVPEGTYYYVISLINNCVEEAVKGSVTIIR